MHKELKLYFYNTPGVFMCISKQDTGGYSGIRKRLNKPISVIY